MEGVAGVALGSVAVSIADSAPILADVVLADPLAAPADSVATLPATAQVTVYVAPTGTPDITGTPSFAVTAISAHGVVFDLSDGYTLSIDKLDSAVFVANSATNETVRVWGAGNIQLDGADAARFWGTTTLVLSNGTKITLETAADSTVTDLYWLDRLTVTRDRYAMVISGVSPQAAEALAIVQGLNGEDCDSATRDGLTLKQASAGAGSDSPGAAGWVDELGLVVDQSVLDATAPGRDYGPGSTLMSWGEFDTVLRRYLGFTQVVSARDTFADPGSNETRDGDVAARAAALRRSIALHAATAGGSACALRFAVTH